MSIQYKVEENQLTTPPSYTVRFVPRGSAGIEDIAADIALRHPNFSKADILTILDAEDEAVMARLLGGEQVTKEGCCTWFPSFAGRLDSPDDPLPPLKDCLQVRFYPSRRLNNAVRQGGRAERLPMTKKLPLISQALDSLLKLNDVLNTNGVLEGTRSDRAVQSRLVSVSNARSSSFRTLVRD